MGDKTAFLFTGQGSQYVGMGKDLYEQEPRAREIFERADRALGVPISRLCFEGPEEDLRLTVNTQPATLTHSYAAFVALGVTPDLAAGHSLGEYTALVAAGSLGFEDAIRLVRKRGEAMTRAVPPGEGGMVVMRKMSYDEVKQAVEGVCTGTLEIANLNTPEQIVVSGDKAAIEEIEATLGRRHAFVLPVSTAFHSSLMKPAEELFAPELDGVEFRDLAFPIYTNVDARKITRGAEAREALKRQICGSVLWQTSIEKMLLQDGVRTFVECGPKKALYEMASVISAPHGVDVVRYRVDTAETLREAREGLLE